MTFADVVSEFVPKMLLNLKKRKFLLSIHDVQIVPNACGRARLRLLSLIEMEF